jgi:hypothetical protein
MAGRGYRRPKTLSTRVTLLSPLGARTERTAERGGRHLLVGDHQPFVQPLAFIWPTSSANSRAGSGGRAGSVPLMVPVVAVPLSRTEPPVSVGQHPAVVGLQSC